MAYNSSNVVMGKYVLVLQNIIDMLCILDLNVMFHRDSICPYFGAPNVINLALAQIVVNSTSLFFLQ